MRWLAWNNLDRPIIPIDLRRDDWVVAHNVVRQRQSNSAVIVDNIVEAMAHVWGQAGTDQTPLFARWAANILQVLYERNLTLVEAIHLIDRTAHDVLYALTHNLHDRVSRRDWDGATETITNAAAWPLATNGRDQIMNNFPFASSWISKRRSVGTT